MSAALGGRLAGEIDAAVKASTKAAAEIALTVADDAFKAGCLTLADEMYRRTLKAFPQDFLTSQRQRAQIGIDALVLASKNVSRVAGGDDMVNRLKLDVANLHDVCGLTENHDSIKDRFAFAECASRSSALHRAILNDATAANNLRSGTACNSERWEVSSEYEGLFAALAAKISRKSSTVGESLSPRALMLSLIVLLMTPVFLRRR
jgi:hypothetical protein